MVAGLNNPVLDLRLATGDRRVTQFLGRLDPMRDRTGAMSCFIDHCRGGLITTNEKKSFLEID
jgi:hypothetical protein